MESDREYAAFIDTTRVADKDRILTPVGDLDRLWSHIRQAIDKINAMPFVNAQTYMLVHEDDAPAIREALSLSECQGQIEVLVEPHAKVKRGTVMVGHLPGYVGRNVCDEKADE